MGVGIDGSGGVEGGPALLEAEVAVVSPSLPLPLGVLLGVVGVVRHSSRLRRVGLPAPSTRPET